MIDTNVPLSRACATASWTLAGLLLVAAWITFPLGNDHLAVLLGMTAVPFVGSAATLTVRGWVCRICQLMRVTAGSDRLPDDVARLR